MFAGSPKKRRAVSMAVESQAPAPVEKQVDNEGDALMASARSASEVPRLKMMANAAAPLRKSASGATFARLRVAATPEGTSSELPSPRIQTEVDASYCSYDVTNIKYVGNQSPVSNYGFSLDVTGICRGRLLSAGLDDSSNLSHFYVYLSFR